MAKIVGIEGMSDADLNAAIADGAKLVVYHYTISILVMTFRRGSAVHFVPAGQSAVVKGLPYTVLTLVAGWWGFPWGPIYTVGSLVKNLSGGNRRHPVRADRRRSGGDAATQAAGGRIAGDDAGPTDATQLLCRKSFRSHRDETRATFLVTAIPPSSQKGESDDLC